MITTTTDEAFARRRLMAAVSATTAPILSTQAIDDLMMMADPDGTGTFTDAALGSAAAVGWSDKAAAAAASFDDIGAGGGVYVKRLQSLHGTCLTMAERYRTGAISVLNGDTGTGRRKGIQSFTMIPDNR